MAVGLLAILDDVATLFDDAAVRAVVPATNNSINRFCLYQLSRLFLIKLS